MLVRSVYNSYGIERALEVVNRVYDNNVRFKRFDHVGATKGGGEKYRVTLTVNDSAGPGARRSHSGRRLAAACWHVHGLFMDLLPRGCDIVTSTSNGRVVKHPGDPWDDIAIGSYYREKWMSECCECPSNGEGLGHKLLLSLCEGPFDDSYGDKVYIIDGWHKYNAIDNYGRHVGCLFSNVEIVFDDEYFPCVESCGRAIRTSPDSYHWIAEYWDTEYGPVCSNCVAELDLAADYLGERINNHRLPVSVEVLHPGDHGWEIVDIRFENGLHYGMNDDPEAIGSVLSDAGMDWLFTYDTSQFYVTFWVWVRQGMGEAAKLILSEANTNLDYDPATEMAKALAGKESVYNVETTRMTINDAGDMVPAGPDDRSFEYTKIGG